MSDPMTEMKLAQLERRIAFPEESSAWEVVNGWRAEHNGYDVVVTVNGPGATRCMALEKLREAVETKRRKARTEGT